MYIVFEILMFTYNYNLPYLSPYINSVTTPELMYIYSSLTLSNEDIRMKLILCISIHRHVSIKDVQIGFRVGLMFTYNLPYLSPYIH